MMRHKWIVVFFFDFFFVGKDTYIGDKSTATVVNNINNIHMSIVRMA